MVSISGSVGRNGMNRLQDVRLIQELLNRHKQPTAQPLKVDGLVGPRTIAAIEDFQRRVVRMARPDGRVDPGGRTLAALTAGPSTPGTPVDARLSGATWWHANQAKYPNSTSVNDLEAGFKANVEAFL
jgi:peptidoglycan hydrolase-like protein with peptidoglycan-binding domain